MRGRRLLIVLLVFVVLMLGVYIAARQVLGSDLVRRTLEQQMAAAFRQPVHIGSATAAIFPRIAVKLGDVSIGDPVAVQVREIRIATGLRPLLSRIVDDAEVLVSDGTVQLPLSLGLPPAGGGHDSSGHESSDRENSGGLTVASVRTIGVRSLSFVAAKQTFVVDADSSLRGDRLEVSRLSARAGTTRIDSSGVLESVARFAGQFEARANPLDLDELMTFASAMTAPTSAKTARGEPAGEMHLRIAMTAPVGRFAQNSFRDLSTTVEVVPGRLRLAPLTVQGFGGSFDGRLEADTAREVPQLHLTGRIGAFDVAEVLKASGSPGGITGRLGGNVSLNGSGTDSETLMRTARGTITAQITDGSMPHLEMVRTIVLAFGKPSGAPPPGSGSAFSRLGGTFTLANGTAASNDIAMNARDFDMTGEGRLHILTGAVSARGDVVLSQELTSQAGTDLRRYAQQDGRVIIPATISGTLQQPQVSLDLVAAARRALGNELQRRVKSWVGDLLKKKK